ncbi:MAG: hypothetical protein H7Z11_00835 [Verrucomicrobia bacterium]|nr:hypothetical protein [Leptolyngbya sp. ES-bin-22]
MHILNDATLIQQFISGEATLAANQNLRIESAFDSVQLLSKRGGLLASIKRIASRQTVLMRQKSDYSTLMHQVLLAHHFIPTPGRGDQPGFEQYRADEIPAGYEVTYATAKELWKEWWRKARQASIHSIHTDLLIFARDTWYPIRNIICSEGVLFITTLVSEASFESDAQLTWLRRLPAPRSAAIPPTSPILAQSLHPLSKAAQATTNQKEHPIVSASASFLSKPAVSASDPSAPDLRAVLRFRQGKLYVTTALGDVVVEGNHLKYRLDEGMRGTKPQEPLNLRGYRESRVVNQ